MRERYADSGPTLVFEYLAEQHGTTLSRYTLRQMLMATDVWKAKVSKLARLYQSRYRRECRGELVQVDGSNHDWFEGRGRRCTLLVCIDDAISELMHLELAESESTYSYMRAPRSYLKRHGKPVACSVEPDSLENAVMARHHSAGLIRASSIRPVLPTISSDAGAINANAWKGHPGGTSNALLTANLVPAAMTRAISRSSPHVNVQ